MSHRLFRPKSIHIRLRRAVAAVAATSVAAFVAAGMSAVPASAATGPVAPGASLFTPKPPTTGTAQTATRVAKLDAALAAALAAATVVSFTFDNQWATQMTAATALKAHGMAGTFYTISGWIGLPGFLTLANLQTLVANGDEIGGKNVNKSDLPTP